jgi:hypothetical protein
VLFDAVWRVISCALGDEFLTRLEGGEAGDAMRLPRKNPTRPVTVWRAVLSAHATHFRGFCTRETG